MGVGMLFKRNTVAASIFTDKIVKHIKENLRVVDMHMSKYNDKPVFAVKKPPVLLGYSFFMQRGTNLQSQHFLYVQWCNGPDQAEDEWI